MVKLASSWQRQLQSWAPGARGALVAQEARRPPAESLDRLGPLCSPGVSPRRLPKMPTPPPFEHQAAPERAFLFTTHATRPHWVASFRSGDRPTLPCNPTYPRRNRCVQTATLCMKQTSSAAATASQPQAEPQLQPDPLTRRPSALRQRRCRGTRARAPVSRSAALVESGFRMVPQLATLASSYGPGGWAALGSALKRRA